MIVLGQGALTFLDRTSSQDRYLTVAIVMCFISSVPLPAFILGPASSGEGVCYPSGQDGGDLLSNLTYLG